MSSQPSRRRFDQYRHTIRERHASGEQPRPHGHTDRNPKKLGTRERQFWELFRAFLKLISGHRKEVGFAMFFLTIGIGLRLIPPLGTKLAIDLALTDPPKPVPPWLEFLPLSSDPMSLLVTIAVVVVVVTMLSTVVNLTSRWTATKAVNQTQVSIRRLRCQE